MKRDRLSGLTDDNKKEIFAVMVSEADEKAFNVSLTDTLDSLQPENIV